MKQILSLVFTFSLLVAGQTAFGQNYLSQSFKGFVSQNSTIFYFAPHFATDTGYAIETTTTDVQSSLNRLSENDYITGNAYVDVASKKIRIDSIDYVGLHRLLGPWKSTEGLMIFKDFSNMRFFPRASARPESDESTDQQQDFRYSLSPSNSGDWILFLSDSKSTTFATVEFDTNNILLKIFDSESGNILRTLILERP